MIKKTENPFKIDRVTGRQIKQSGIVFQIFWRQEKAQQFFGKPNIRTGISKKLKKKTIHCKIKQ